LGDYTPSYIWVRGTVPCRRFSVRIEVIPSFCPDAKCSTRSSHIEPQSSSFEAEPSSNSLLHPICQLLEGHPSMDSIARFLGASGRLYRASSLGVAELVPQQVAGLLPTLKLASGAKRRTRRVLKQGRLSNRPVRSSIQLLP
jgi:hypothetical protein